MELLGYQRPVYERFSRLVDKEGRCAIVLPTGLGKFFLAAQWAVDNPGTSFLHVVPHRDISDHQMARFAEVYPGEGLSNMRSATYAELVAWHKGGCAGGLPCDAIVLDEFHHIGAAVWGPPSTPCASGSPTRRSWGCRRLPTGPPTGLSLIHI